MNTEIEKLLIERHIEKLNTCLDHFFIFLIVIKVKRDQTLQQALDSEVLNKFNHKNLYQMPKIETLIDSLSLYKTKQSDKIFFSIKDLKFAYRLLNLHHDTAKHCNFNIVSCDMIRAKSIQQ